MVQPLTGPADPGGDAAAELPAGLTPLSPLQIASSSGPSAESTAFPGPSTSSSQARPEVAQKAPHSKAGKAQLAAASRSGAVVVDPKASIWKIRLHPAGLSRENDLINLILPIAVTRNMKTHLRILMTPKNPLTGRSRVLPQLPWPPAPLVTLPDILVMGTECFFHSPLASVHGQPFHRVI